MKSAAPPARGTAEEAGHVTSRFRSRRGKALARPGPLREKAVPGGRSTTRASTPKNRLFRPAYQPPPQPAGAWTSYTTFSSRSPGAEHRGRGGFRAVPAWVTSLNSAPPSGPIRESRRPRLSTASGPAARPECVRTRRRTVPFQPPPDVQSGEPRSLCGLPRRAVISAVQTGGSGSRRTSS